MMSDKRAGVFEDDLDVSGFAPKPPARAEQVKAVAEEAGFRSRGPLPIPAPASTPARAARPGQPDAAGRGRGVARRTAGAAALPHRPEPAVEPEGAGGGCGGLLRHRRCAGLVLGDVFARAVAALTQELQKDKR